MNRKPRIYLNPEDIKNLSKNVDEQYEVMIRTYILPNRPLIVYGGNVSLNNKKETT